VLDCAKKYFGLDYLYPMQRLVIANILEAISGGRDISSYSLHTHSVWLDEERDKRDHQLVILPTGAGKSLCFQLPPYFYSGVTVVVYPLISLLNDQARRMASVGLVPLILRGGLSKVDVEHIAHSMQEKKRVVLLTNPEALYMSSLRKDLSRIHVSHFVIDEAHCIVQWGTTFRKSYLMLPEIIHECAPKMVTAFTATASPAIIDGIRSLLFEDKHMNVVSGNPDRMNIGYAVIPCLHSLVSLLMMISVSLKRIQQGENQTKKEAEKKFWDKIFKKSKSLRGGSQNVYKKWVHQRFYPRIEVPCIIFCPTRNKTEYCAWLLRSTLGYSEIRCYHAGLSREEKKNTEGWFFASDRGILCATCAYGMGVDKKNIRTVIHLSPSSTPESYIQEAGRAGRDKNPAQALLLWDISREWTWEREKKHRIAESFQEIGERKNGISAKYTLPQTEKSDTAGHTQNRFFDIYTRSYGCRRNMLMKHLGADSVFCDNCDLCTGVEFSIVGVGELYSAVTMNRFDTSGVVKYLCMKNQSNDFLAGSFDQVPSKLMHSMIDRALSIGMLEQRKMEKGRLFWGFRKKNP